MEIRRGSVCEVQLNETIELHFCLLNDAERDVLAIAALLVHVAELLDR